MSWRGGAAGLGLGALAIVGACIAWGIDNNLIRKLSSADPVQIAMTKGLVAGVVNLSLGVGRGAVSPPVESIASASVVGFFGYGVSLVLFVLGLRHLGSARTGAYFSMAPFIGALIAIGLFGEPITVRLVIAALFVGIGLYLNLAERHAHERDPLQHTHNHVHDAHHQHCHVPEDAKGEPHSHVHRHEPLVHAHAHYPDLYHRHRHVG